MQISAQRKKTATDVFGYYPWIGAIGFTALLIEMALSLNSTIVLLLLLGEFVLYITLATRSFYLPAAATALAGWLLAVAIPLQWAANSSISDPVLKALFMICAFGPIWLLHLIGELLKQLPGEK